MDEVVKYLKALVVLQVQSMSEGAGFAKPEVLLAQCGFAHKEIAEILGKSQAAIAKSISRAKKAPQETNDGK